MKKLQLPCLVFLIFCLNHTLTAQPLIHIPFGKTPVIDGTISTGEWQDCDSVNIRIMSGSAEVKVLYKHDSLNLYAAFVNNLESANVRFPEILLDINNAKSTSWQTDDWWFHASGSDCDYKGAHSNYDSCELVRPNWKAERNFTMTPPITDTVEIQLPFSTIGIDINTVDTIGISFEVTNTFSAWEYWPQSADIDDPSTWANAVFGPVQPTGITKSPAQKEFNLYPNPNEGQFSIEIQTKSVAEFSIVNILGKTIFSRPVSPIGNDVVIQLDLNLQPGIYFSRLISGEGEVTQKMIVQ